MNTASVAYWPAVAFALCAFWFMLVQKLRATRYSSPVAFGVGLVALAQPAYLHTDALRSALFSAVSFATVWAATALVQRQEPRRIVLLGSSLAGAQFLHPLCGVATTFVLPLALRKALAGTATRQGAGLYISLLFIPLLAFAYWSVAQPELSGLRNLPAKISGPLPAPALAPIFTAIPVAVAAAMLRHAICLPLIAVIGTISSVGVLGTLLGLQQPNVASAALAALSVFVASCWPPSPRRERNAMLLGAAVAVLSWTSALHPATFHA